VISQKKFESNLILIVPFVFLSLLKWSSPDYLNVLYYTNLGIVLMTFALILLMISYWMLRKIMRIQI
jgi:tight adherence protein B